MNQLHEQEPPTTVQQVAERIVQLDKKVRELEDRLFGTRIVLAVAVVGGAVVYLLS